jgi:1-aminocyclopropane-1-carboxylate deaminase/D-cysteine desulfhydrase-like pyridoxal-dependent ACC family enzyme
MWPMTTAELRAALARFPSVPFLAAPTPVEPLTRLSSRLGGGPRLFIKRDDAIPFGFGGNKVRKLALVAGQARAEDADTLITAGGLQSNHARATAAAAARLGMRAVLVANGTPPARKTANALLDELLGAEVVYVGSREERMPKIQELAASLRAEGRRPFAIPIGASTPLGALAFALAVAELVDQMPAPDVIVHSTSSGGTQAGLVAGCRLLGLPTRVIGVSADDASSSLEGQVNAIVTGVGALLRLDAAALAAGTAIEVDDRFVGGGYGVPSDQSREAIELTARSEAIFLDPTYTSKAMAGLIAYVGDRAFGENQTVLFWHTGGQVGLFA